MTRLESISLEAIQNARRRIADLAIRTPLVRLNLELPDTEVYLKLENLQPIGSFKLRGAANAIRNATPVQLSKGVYTASAGNMAQGVAYVARAMGIKCSVIVPEQAPRAKLDAIERLGGAIIKVSFDEWWQTMLEHGRDGMDGFFVHPFGQADVVAGNGTIGLEIVEDLPEVDAVIVPYGGGGLITGIATALQHMKPESNVFACEVETAAPLKASLQIGAPTSIEHTRSFVDGIGGKSVFEEMWPLVSELVTDSIVVSLRQVADAIHLLVERNCVVAEGAGGASVASALSRQAGTGKIVCVISGGNIDSDKLAIILKGEIPEP